jgi:signal transduction histidine kinase
MKSKLKALSERYQKALRTHLKQGGKTNLQPALALGRQAAALGLETLDVAGIHERALAPLAASGSRDGLTKRSEAFFAAAITPIEENHRAARRANVRLGKLKKTLNRRTLDLAASHCSLKQGIIQRKTVAQALKERREHSRKLLRESRRLQKHLQCLTRRLLSAQEAKRKQISRALHDAIAQTLLAIHVRLLTLKKEAAVNARSLKKEIASTQRLVDKSVKSIQRFAREFDVHHWP